MYIIQFLHKITKYIPRILCFGLFLSPIYLLSQSDVFAEDPAHKTAAKAPGDADQVASEPPAAPAQPVSETPVDTRPIEEQIAIYRDDFRRPGGIFYPPENPYSAAKYVLGKMLFFDPRLSDTGTISCATCHNPAFYFTDALPIAKGKGHEEVGGRKTMSLYNLAWDTDRMLWDGRVKSLEEQVKEALEAKKGMAMGIKNAVAKIQSIESYKSLFKEAYKDRAEPEYTEGDYINFKTISSAIATFERSLVSSVSPFDMWVSGKKDAISDDAKKGFLIFNTKGNCASCHSSWRFSDGRYYDIGVDRSYGLAQIKRFEGMKKEDTWPDYFAFKNVGLRNIERRAPYMRDGSLKTLEEVIDFYDKGGNVGKRPTLKINPLNLSAEEKKQLIEFLKTLNSDEPEVTIPYLPR